MKRIVLVHGWTGHPQSDWIPWLRNELEKINFIVFVPALPDTEHPKMDAWVKHLTKVIGYPDENCYLIGHSLGCITILRYLETLRENQKIGGAVLVAGFASNLGYEEIESFFKKPIDWEKIKSHCKKFIAIHSDNDPYVSLHYGDIFKEKLNAEVIVQHDMKHFSENDDITELPIALESVLKISL
jgi:predicted alpha/beta hydrolase family esterase